MNSLNSIILEGRLTRNPEERTHKGEVTLCEMNLASNRIYRKADDKEEEVSFFDVECWGRIAENCLKYLEKGRSVRVVGRLKQNRWKKDGMNHSKVIIVAEHIEFRNEHKGEHHVG